MSDLAAAGGSSLHEPVTAGSLEPEAMPSDGPRVSTVSPVQRMSAVLQITCMIFSNLCHWKCSGVGVLCARANIKLLPERHYKKNT